MVEGLISTFRHELVSTVLVTVFIGALTYPFKKITAAYKETQESLKGIATELAEQRSNCLTTLQGQGVSQIEILKEVASTLRDMHLDQKTLLGRLDR